MSSQLSFAWRRRQNWIIIGVLYALFMMSRYNYSAISPLLLAAFGWTKEDLSILETALPFFYGLSVIVNSVIVDRIGGRKAYLIGSAGVVVANLAFGAGQWIIGDFTPTHTAYIMSAVWAVNAYFQSFGAMAILKINAQWFTKDERGTFSAIFGVLIRMGLVFAFSGVPLIAKVTGAWYWGFWIPAGLVAVFAILDYFFAADKPEEDGYPAVVPDSAGTIKDSSSILEAIKDILGSRPILILALASIMIGFVRRSVVDSWWPLYLSEALKISGTSLIAQIMPWGIAIFGIAGGFALGPISDKFKRRAPIIATGFVGMAVGLLLFYFVGANSLNGWEAVICISFLSFFVNGVHGLLMGAVTMDLGGKRSTAKVAGLFDGAQHFFAAPFTGRLVGYITTNYSWDTWKLWPVPFAVTGAILMLFVWNMKTDKGGGH